MLQQLENVGCAISGAAYRTSHVIRQRARTYARVGVHKTFYYSEVVLGRLQGVKELTDGRPLNRVAATAGASG